MDKKVVLLVIFLLIIVSSAYFLISNKKDVYSDNPKTWIEDKPTFKEINVDKVTKGKAYVNYLGEQYRDGIIETVFTYDGIYKGKIFDNQYTDENGNLLIKISNELNPGDGVLDGYIIERIEDNNPVAFIFLDEDWKNIIGAKTNIIWGKDYERTVKFNFDEIDDGVYMHEILDDPDRFDNNFKESVGGIVVGDITKLNIENNELLDVIIIRMI